MDAEDIMGGSREVCASIVFLGREVVCSEESGAINHPALMADLKVVGWDEGRGVRVCWWCKREFVVVSLLLSLDRGFHFRACRKGDGLGAQGWPAQAT